MGKVIGRGGRTAKAIRAVVRAAATRQGIIGATSTSPTEVAEPTVVVGKVTKAHGLRGEVAVQSAPTTPIGSPPAPPCCCPRTAGRSPSSDAHDTAPACW